MAGWRPGVEERDANGEDEVEPNTVRRRMNTSRTAWGLAAVLAVVLLGGIGVLFVRLKPYWVARYHGVGADLHDAVLINPPLAGANLQGVNLRHADLHGAKLCRAELSAVEKRKSQNPFYYLQYANLIGTDLTGADLTQANLTGTNLIEADLTGANLADAS